MTADNTTLRYHVHGSRSAAESHLKGNAGDTGGRAVLGVTPHGIPQDNEGQMSTMAGLVEGDVADRKCENRTAMFTHQSHQILR